MKTWIISAFGISGHILFWKRFLNRLPKMELIFIHTQYIIQLSCLTQIRTSWLWFNWEFL